MARPPDPWLRDNGNIREYLQQMEKRRKRVAFWSYTGFIIAIIAFGFLIGE